MIKNKFFIPILVSILLGASAQAEILFSTNMNSASGSFGFEGTYPSGNYSLDLTSGGYNSNGAHIVINRNALQFPFGFYHPGSKPGGWTWNDVAYVRFRIKFDDNFRWDGDGSQQNKMVDIGGGANARVILHNEKDRPSEPCALNYTEYTSSGPITYNTAQDYGLPSNAFSSGDYGSLALKNGINPPCTPPVVVTHGVWYHVQFAVKISSSSGRSDGFFKLWVNNNDINNPSTEVLNIIRELGEWNSSWDVGHYWTHDNPNRSQGWVIDDYQTATTFDPNWAPSGAASPWTQNGDRGTLATTTSTVVPTTTTTSTSGTTLFQDTFESGNFNSWDYVTGGMSIVSSGCAVGSRCVRTSLTGGTFNNYYGDFLFGDHASVRGDKVEEVYLTLHSKFDVGYTWANRSQKIALLNLTDGVSNDRRYQVYLYVTPDGYYAVDHSYIDTWDFFRLAQNQGAAAPVRFGQWDALKLYVRLNDPGLSNGVVRLWINDELKISYSDVNIRRNTNYGMNKLIISTYTTGDGGSNGVQWHDDFLLTTADPGSTGGGGGTTINLAPNPPILLQ
ncbi:MAG: polysaccharide lyase [Candidatus Thiodiazotropha sp.]